MIIIFLAILVLFGESAIFYVSPDGDDTKNSGVSTTEALKTIVKAKELLRSKKTESNIVYILPGRYDEQITFTHEDSASSGKTNTYRAFNMANKPYIFGGKIIDSEWKYDETLKAYKTFIGKGIESRQLFVNNRRTIRARGELPGSTVKTSTGYQLPAGYDWGNWEDQSNLEFVQSKAWVQKRCLVKQISGRDITMQNPCFNDATTGLNYTRFTYPTWIENNLKLLNEPDEWYLNNATGYLYYIPLPNEPIEKSFFYLAVKERIFHGPGTKLNPIKNIVFDGLIFLQSTWMGPNKNDGLGFNEVQSNIRLPDYSSPYGAVDFKYGRNLVVRNCIFTQIDGVGLLLGTGTQNCLVEKNIAIDVSSVGIKIGDVIEGIRADVNDQTRNNIIYNNKVKKIGQAYPAAPGMMIGYCYNCSVRNNELLDLPYTGLSIGWGWAMIVPNFQGGNSISRNLVNNTMLVLRDGGSVYTLGSNVAKSKIFENVFRNQNNCFGALYLDDGSTYWDAFKNVIFGNSQSAMIKGGNHAISQNYWENRGPRKFCGYQGDIHQMSTGKSCAPCVSDICSECGPIDISSNNVITSISQVPNSLLENAGLVTELYLQDIPNFRKTDDDDTSSDDSSRVLLSIGFLILIVLFLES